jgi:hypothetical protein
MEVCLGKEGTSVSNRCHMPGPAHANHHSISSSITQRLVLPYRTVAFHSMSPSSIAAGLPQWPANHPLSPTCTRHAR